MVIEYLKLLIERDRQEATINHNVLMQGRLGSGQEEAIRHLETRLKYAARADRLLDAVNAAITENSNADDE